MRWANTASIRGSISAFAGRSLWVFPSAGTHLQQAHGQRGQQTQQADQAINRRPLPLLNATPTFEALVRVLHLPPFSQEHQSFLQTE